MKDDMWKTIKIDMTQWPWTVPDENMISLPEEKVNELSMFLSSHRHFLLGDMNVCSSILQNLIHANDRFAARIYIEFKDEIEAEIAEIDADIAKTFKGNPGPGTMKKAKKTKPKKKNKSKVKNNVIDFASIKSKRIAS